ncbi:hypothetical protein [Azospirillum picis]|uniref:Uncharacterized protein n=1 Tax=Azospirillum picis TaxID=488438 RepID=A0ABU0MUL5_9PROT|nr:hypothetical protein [Azospirillum picis]MBP2303333.1 hypothetical protein [Azospirillum picis]MDQ0537185.1 hypothetical protein [Azospirillum picis]
MSSILNTPLEYGFPTENLTAGNGTAAKIVVDCLPAGVAAAIAGEVALPGENAVRQRIRQGGGRVIGGSVSSSDSVAKSLLIYIGERLTTQDLSNTGTMALTASTVTRQTGSFIADGWTVGNAFMLFGPPAARNVGSATQANTGLLTVITAVTATTLTVNGAPFTSDAALPAGARLFRVSQRTRRAIAPSAGNADATPAVPLMGGTQDPATASLPDTGWELGQNSALIVALVAALSALPARLDIMAEVALR